MKDIAVIRKRILAPSLRVPKPEKMIGGTRLAFGATIVHCGRRAKSAELASYAHKTRSRLIRSARPSFSCSPLAPLLVLLSHFRAKRRKEAVKNTGICKWVIRDQMSLLARSLARILFARTSAVRALARPPWPSVRGRRY